MWSMNLQTVGAFISFKIWFLKKPIQTVQLQPIVRIRHTDPHLTLASQQCLELQLCAGSLKSVLSCELKWLTEVQKPYQCLCYFYFVLLSRPSSHVAPQLASSPSNGRHWGAGTAVCHKALGTCQDCAGDRAYASDRDWERWVQIRVWRNERSVQPT